MIVRIGYLLVCLTIGVSEQTAYSTSYLRARDLLIPILIYSRKFYEIYVGRLIYVLVCCAGNRLNRYISHYERLSYDKEELLQKHSRAKRSVTNADSAVHLRFSAHSRTFNIRLKRDLSTFSDNLVILDTHGSVLNSSQADTSHIYSGHLIGT